MAGKPTFKHDHYSRIHADEFGPEAPGVTIRRLIDEEFDGAPYYNLRMIEIAPGGHTPEHAHDNEHENFVLDGSGEVLYEVRSTRWARGTSCSSRRRPSTSTGTRVTGRSGSSAACRCRG